LLGTDAFPLSSLSKSNRAGVALRGATGDEMSPRARVPGLLDGYPLDREFSPQSSSFHGLPKRESSRKLASIAGRHG
jgi:hypothetical protein